MGYIDEFMGKWAERFRKGEIPPECEYVEITVRIPVEAYHRGETVVNAKQYAPEVAVRGSREAIVDGLRVLLPRLPKKVSVSYANGLYDGLRSDTADLVAEAQGHEPLTVRYCEDPNCTRCGVKV